MAHVKNTLKAHTTLSAELVTNTSPSPTNLTLVTYTAKEITLMLSKKTELNCINTQQVY